MTELVVLAQIAGRKCAFRAHDVQSVIDVGAITPIPCAPAWIVGLTAMRSQALTVIDCRTAIGFEGGRFDAAERAAVIKVDGFVYALLVDTIDDVAVARSEPAAVPGGFGKEWHVVARGVVETDVGPVLLLNVEALVNAHSPAQAAA